MHIAPEIDMRAKEKAHRRSCVAQAGVGESPLVLLMVALSLPASSAESSAMPPVPAASSATLHRFS